MFRSIDVLGGVVVGSILSTIISLIIPGLRSPREIGLSKLAVGMGLGVAGTLNPVQGSGWAILPFVGGLMAGRGVADLIVPGKGWTWYKKK